MYIAEIIYRRSKETGQRRQLSKKIKVLLDFFQKIVGFQRATPLVAFRRKRNPYALRAFRVANEQCRQLKQNAKIKFKQS